MTTALGTIRSFTTEDQGRLNAFAQRFAGRHCIDLDLNGQEPADALDQHLWSCDTGTWPRAKELKRLWQACRCRALRVEVAANISVAYGYVGYSLR